MTWAGITSAVVLAVAGDAAFAQETYRCKVADVVSLGDDGRLRSDSNSSDVMRRIYNGIIIDTLTGALTYPDGSRTMWSVVQKGGGYNDHVLIPANTFGDQASAATYFIRVRAWSEKPMAHFLAFGLSNFASGPCEVVR